MRDFYPPIMPYATGHLNVGDGQQIYWETSGDPNGKPAVFVHGGPGGGTGPDQRRFFDPAAYRIILFDQRGCGQSTPHLADPDADLSVNTTDHLISDMEKLRAHLGVDRWQVFGGSWGSTLALAYAQRHRDRVTELVLRGIFLLRRSELDWYYNPGGASNIYPDLWEDYLAPIPAAQRDGDLIAAYHRLLTGGDRAAALAAARAWTEWERRTSHLLPQQSSPESDRFALAFAGIENHYFVHGGFLDEGQLLNDIAAIADVPGVIVQGRYDVVCPARSAWDLHRAWPIADLHIVDDAGHASYEAGIKHHLIEATDRFARTS